MANDAHIRWDDIAHVLAVIDHGSVAAAARELGVNHATVLRRIAEFETRTGVRMFDKTTRGYRISPDRRSVVEAMREAAEALGTVERMVEGARPRLGGGLRITTTDTLAQYVLPPLLPAYVKVTGLPVEVTVDNAHIDLSRMQSQLSVRPSPKLPPELDGVQAGFVNWGVFENTSAEPEGWIGLTGPLARTNAARHVRQTGGNPVAYGDSFLAVAAMAAAGLGRSVLPTYVGGAWPELTCTERPDTLKPVPVWVGAHVDFAGTLRIKRARAALAEALESTPALAAAQ